MEEYKLDYEIIGKRIREARGKAKVSQEELAEQVEISKAYMSQIEAGKKHPTLETYVRIVNALDLSMDEMLCGNLEHNKHVHNMRFDQVVGDCDAGEYQMIENVVTELKKAMRRYKEELKTEKTKE